ncbi:MAG TPA: amidohydrolase family protein [Saprospiraceae bacterium]|nr:amidohydrolase family protein [Saprospiraceae bacterium]
MHSCKQILLWLILFLPTALPSQEFSDKVQSFITLKDKSFAIRHITLIDGTGQDVKHDMTVVINDGIITDVGPASKIILPPNIHILDGAGKTLIPGFVMLHEHIFYTKAFEEEFNVVNMTNTFPRMYLAGGVTTMRTAGSVSPHTDLNISKLITQGKMTGPKMDVTGPFIERENNFGIPQLPILPKDQTAGATVDYWADQGCTSFKVYMHITKEDLKQVVEHAHARKMKVTGHLCSISYEEAAEIGIDNLEHGFMTSSDFIRNKSDDYCDVFKMRSSLMALEKDDPEIEALMKKLIAKGVTITTTPAVFAPQAGYELILGGGEDALHPDVLNEVKTFASEILYRDSIANAMFNKELYWIKKFYDMGGKLVVGTDPTGTGRAIAGYANMWTLEILVKAGFTLTEAVMLCSLKGAEYLDRDEKTGSIKTGKEADLILIDGDLEKEVSNIRNIETVFKDGIGYNSKAMFESVKGLVGLF